VGAKEVAATRVEVAEAAELEFARLDLLTGHASKAITTPLSSATVTHNFGGTRLGEWRWLVLELIKPHVLSSIWGHPGVDE
jgi:hypothetical protein